MTWLPKKTVVVPIDFSDESAETISTALEFVEEPADVHVIHVLFALDAAGPGVVWGAVDNESREKTVRSHLDQLLKDNDISGVTTAVKVGDAGLSITEYAREYGADLIVIPSHGFHGMKRLLLGSVAERVIRHANCPVLVLRRHDAQ